MSCFFVKKKQKSIQVGFQNVLLECVLVRWVGKENQSKFRLWPLIEMLTNCLDENCGYQVNNEGGFINIIKGVIKADRFALSRIFGFLSGSSPNRDGKYYMLFFHVFFEIRSISCEML
jgi:hypothetical protein